MQRYFNVIQALVYAGAAFLVVIVGLRGLGDLSQNSYVPTWLLEPETGRISVNFVIAGLVAEFAMLMALAFVFFKAPRVATEVDAPARATAGTQVSGDDIATLIEAERQILETLGKKIETLIDAERRVIEQIGGKYNEVAEAQRTILEAISRRLEEQHSGNDSILKRIESDVEHLRNSSSVRRRHPETTPTLS